MTKDGKEYACYIKDLENLKPGSALSDSEREKCLDLSFVAGDSW